VQGKQHIDPRKETVDPAPFEDQADTFLPGLCKAVEVNVSIREYSGKRITTTQ